MTNMPSDAEIAALCALIYKPDAWIAGGWLRLEAGAFVPGELPDFKRMHPRVYGEIAADFEKWKPPERAVTLPFKQEAML